MDLQHALQDLLDLFVFELQDSLVTDKQGHQAMEDNERSAPETAIEKAVRIAGNQSALARAVDVSPQAVQQWVESGRVSHKKVIAVEAATGVHRSELREDLYPVEKAA